jgi:hypothetical protein
VSNLEAIFAVVRRFMVFGLGCWVIGNALVNPEERLGQLAVGMVMVGVLPIENIFSWRHVEPDSGQKKGPGPLGPGPSSPSAFTHEPSDDYSDDHERQEYHSHHAERVDGVTDAAVEHDASSGRGAAPIVQPHPWLE